MLAKYDSQSITYNRTRKADPYLRGRLLNLLDAKKNEVVLDIGCGTGNYTIELENNGLKMIGIDPSSGMLEKAKMKGSKVKWLNGKVENIPLENESVDHVIGSLTIHHWNDLKKGFQEVNRVLRPGGKTVIFTATPKQMEGYWLNHYFPKMMKSSMSQMPDLDLAIKLMEDSGFRIIKNEKYFIKEDLQDLFLYSGKHNPSLYFDPEIRNGISSFSLLANKNEVHTGLQSIKVDLSSGIIHNVIGDYSNNEGDYLFIIGIK